MASLRPCKSIQKSTIFARKESCCSCGNLNLSHTILACFLFHCTPSSPKLDLLGLPVRSGPVQFWRTSICLVRLYKSIQKSMILNRKEICYSYGNLDLSLCHFILSVMNSLYDTLVRSSSEGPEFFKSDRTLLLQEHPKESCCSCGNLDLSYTNYPTVSE